MSLMSKTKTVTHSVRKDVPTPRVPIRSDYHTWKIDRSDTRIPSSQSRSIEGIQKSLADISSNFHSLHQSSNIPCSVQRSSYSSITTTKTIAGNLNPVKNISTVSDTSTIKALQNIAIPTVRPTTIESNLNPAKSKVAFSEASTLKSLQNIAIPIAKPATIESNLNPVKSKVAFSETSTLKSLQNIDSATARPTTKVSNLSPVKRKVTLSDRSARTIVQNNDTVTARPAIRECAIVTNTSSTKTKIISSSHKVLVNKSHEIPNEEFSPLLQRKSIIDDMNILKTPVNDSLTRKIILTNVVPVTSLITETHHYKENRRISDEPTARNALRDGGHFLDTVLSKLDDSLTQVEESQTLNTMVVKNISDTCTYKVAKEALISPMLDQTPEADMSLTARKGSESTVFTRENELLTNIENVVPTNLSRNDTESVLLQAEDPERSLIVEGKKENSKAAPGLKTSDECITSIPKEINLNIEDDPIDKSYVNDIDKETIITPNTIIESRTELENTSSKTKRKLYVDNETSEILSPASSILIDLPPLISPMNSDNTAASDNISYMTPDSTTDLVINTSRSIKTTTNKQRKTTLKRKMHNRQISVKRKLRDISSPSCPCDNESKKESIKRSRGRPKKDETTIRKKTCSKSKTSRRKKTISKSDLHYEYVSENPTSPKTRNMMINPRTRNMRSQLLLTMD